MGNSCFFMIAAVLTGLSITPTECQLANNYHMSLCPNVESIVRKEVLSIMFTDVTAPAAFLRLLFHDCQVQGCDASILLDSEESEMISSKNFGIRMREEVGKIKSLVEAECPGIVSCADIIALAARESVAFTGGPSIQIPLGRKDATTSSNHKADIHLPSSQISIDGLIYTFKSKIMSLEESIAILGAHTLGVGHCINIVDRLYNPKPEDKIDNNFEAQLRLICPHPTPRTNITFVANDLTPTIFDNQYFRNVLMGEGLFGIDSSISKDPRTRPTVEQFAVDQDYFFQVFSSAFLKLSSANVLSGGHGEIRRQCNRRNM